MTFDFYCVEILWVGNGTVIRAVLFRFCCERFTVFLDVLRALYIVIVAPFLSNFGYVGDPDS